MWIILFNVEIGMISKQQSGSAGESGSIRVCVCVFECFFLPLVSLESYKDHAFEAHKKNI